MPYVVNISKQSPPKVEIKKYYNLMSFDVPDVKWVERYLVGTSNPLSPLTETEISKQLERINRELRYGKILSIETNINQFECNNKTIIHQWTVYHIGYKSRPEGK